MFPLNIYSLIANRYFLMTYDNATYVGYERYVELEFICAETSKSLDRAVKSIDSSTKVKIQSAMEIVNASVYTMTSLLYDIRVGTKKQYRTLKVFHEGMVRMCEEEERLIPAMKSIGVQIYMQQMFVLNLNFTCKSN